jgi:BA14K-like protein
MSTLRKMSTLRNTITAATILASLVSSAATPAWSGDYRVLRYGNTSGWYYDGRDDDRDFPTNGFFPGNFAADPSSAWIGGAGLFGSNPERSALPYPSQVVIGSARDPSYCARRFRSYDPASSTFVGRDGVRHPC